MDPSDDEFGGGVLGLLASYYVAARSELVQRMVLREGTLTLFLGATAALFSFAAGGGSTQKWALFVIPLLGAGTASINLQHTTTIRSISRYLATEFQTEVGRATRLVPVHWDASRSRHIGLHRTSIMRAVAAMLLIVVPEVVSAVAAIRSLGTGPWPVAAFGASVVAVLASIWLLALAYSGRPWNHPTPPAGVPEPRDATEAVEPTRTA